MTKKTLLLVDRSRVLMDIIKKIFERQGYNISCADSIAGAQKQIDKSLPDGIVLETELPDGSGIEYCRILCERYTIPILFLSGDTEDELPAFDAGAMDFMKKPFDFEILKIRLRIMLYGIGKKEGF